MEGFKKITVNDDVLLYAMRYSLTRKTNAPAQVMNAILKNIDAISVENIGKMIKEIESSTDIGYLLYEDTWNGLLKDLKLELKIRAAKS